jgi:hypothetical protein
LTADLEHRGVISRRSYPTSAPRPAAGARAIALCASAAANMKSLVTRTALLLLLARISFAFFGLAVTQTAWKSRIRNGGSPRHQDEPSQIDLTVRSISARLPFGGDCKERALCAWAIAQRAGLSAAIVVGIVQYPVGGHAWCELPDGTIVGDTAEHCRPYLPILRYE